MSPPGEAGDAVMLPYAPAAQSSVKELAAKLRATVWAGGAKRRLEGTCGSSVTCPACGAEFVVAAAAGNQAGGTVAAQELQHGKGGEAMARAFKGSLGR